MEDDPNLPGGEFRHYLFRSASCFKLMAGSSAYIHVLVYSLGDEDKSYHSSSSKSPLLAETVPSYTLSDP
jgi:hypothetical protein